MPPKKDPNKPKGRMSAYAFFVQHRRAHYKSEGKECQFTPFSRECSEIWSSTEDKDKAKYMQMAEKDKERYLREMASYVPPDGVRKKGRGSGKKDKDPNRPKRAMSAFFYFAADKREKLRADDPKATVGDIAKKLGAAWKVMSKTQKETYEESAKKDRSRYDKEMQAYKKTAVVEAPDEEEEEEEYSEED